MRQKGVPFTERDDAVARGADCSATKFGEKGIFHKKYILGKSDSRIGTQVTVPTPQHRRSSGGVLMEHSQQGTRAERAESCVKSCALQGAPKVSKNINFGRNTKNPPSNSDSIGAGPIASACRSRDISALEEVSKKYNF